MKKTPIKSRTSLARKAMKRKLRKNDHPEIRAAYRDEHEACLVCERNTLTTFGIWGETHHVCPGNGRVDDPRALATLCNECHHEFHNGYGLPIEVLLWFKRERDPDNYSLDFLRSLRKSLRLIEPTAPDWSGLPPWIA